MQLEICQSKLGKAFCRKFWEIVPDFLYLFCDTIDGKFRRGFKTDGSVRNCQYSSLFFTALQHISMFWEHISMFFKHICWQKITDLRKVNIVTFQSSSVMAPTRMSRWIVSVGLRIAALGIKSEISTKTLP